MLLVVGGDGGSGVSVRTRGMKEAGSAIFAALFKNAWRTPRLTDCCCSLSRVLMIFFQVSESVGVQPFANAIRFLAKPTGALLLVHPPPVLFLVGVFVRLH
jgi:hypothetical protein